MKIAVLSGKGGAGKTFVSVNLAATAPLAVYIDCDVEEPNGRLFLKPHNPKEETVFTPLPTFDQAKCIGCRACVSFCRFGALAYIKDKPKVFAEVCHSCGGCALVCSQNAIDEIQRPVGIIEVGSYNNVTVVTGVLNTGEASAVPVIKGALQKATSPQGLTIIDCPPGSGCSVLESVSTADYCILVAEPTAFGLHNLQMVCELARLLGKPIGIVINKQDQPYLPLEEFCKQQEIKVLCRIPYSQHLAEICAAGKVASEEDPQMAELFSQLLSTVYKEVAR